MLRRFVLLISLLLAAPALAQDKLVIFAAASLTEALSEAGAAYTNAGHPPPVFSFAGSKNLKSAQPLYPAPRRFPEAGGEAE